MLVLKDIKKDYVVAGSPVPALRGVDIAFRESEFTSILGPSGCGKTTLLNIIGGLDRYTSGDLQINGKSTKEYKSSDWDAYRNKRIGFIFQSYNLIPHLDILHNVELALTLTGVSVKERRERAKAALEEVGLADKLKNKPNQLSGGQMQRVSIARALVNNPDIILADEPTGALDSNTSVQIMELLSSISKDKLVIMVTHNADLAKEYSTRTISLLDGLVVGDTNPYEIEEAAAVTAGAESAVAETTEKSGAKKFKPRMLGKKIRQKKNKTSMSFFTALSLSMRNLFTKKVRTTITAIAGSIGIIGVGLVLAINNGFNAFITQMETETLSGFPITVMKYTYNADKVENIMNDFMGYAPGFTTPTDPTDPDGNPLKPFPSDNTIISKGSESSALPSDMGAADFMKTVMEMMKEMVVMNKLTDEYFTHLENMDSDLGVTQLVYSINMHLLGKKADNSVFLTTNEKLNFTELSGGRNYVEQQYELLDGSYPDGAFEAVVVVDKYNRISSDVLNALGIDPKRTDIRISDLMNSNLKLIDNNGFYVKDEAKNTFKAKESDEELTALYSDAVNAHPIKITGVLRVKKNSTSDVIKSGIAYPNELITAAFNRAKASDIAVAQLESESIDVLTGKRFTVDFPFSLLGFTAQDMYNDALAAFGAVEIPEAAFIYPYGFSEKNAIKSYLSEYNNNKPISQRIEYTDMAETATEMARQIIDIVTIVLSCFAGIALVVSTVMISIITYVSVVERTKEIGILRSIGARKIDIGNVFNAETVIIGLTAGALGVAVTYLLSIPVNLIIQHYAGVDANIAALNPLNAILLIGVSTFLTFIAGLIPAFLASKKDPVVALRTD